MREPLESLDRGVLVSNECAVEGRDTLKIDSASLDHIAETQGERATVGIRDIDATERSGKSLVLEEQKDLLFAGVHKSESRSQMRLCWESRLLEVSKAAAESCRVDAHAEHVLS